MQPDWIAADWGTSNLRLWLMAGDAVMAQRHSDRGMATMAGPGDFAATLATLTADWPPLPVIACGMVGARQGWVEVSYRAAPCPARPQLHRVPDTQPPVWIAAGVMQRQPADVMRGEETQIAGVLAAQPDFDGILCLPGTHSKWVRISAGEICHFQTVMTGEIHALLSRQSVLRHSLGGTVDPDNPAFGAAVDQALSRPHAAWAALFRLRAADVIGQPDPEAASTLSGLLIGLDLGATRPHWLGMEIGIVGDDLLARLYAKALARQGLHPTLYPAEQATLAGLAAARKDIP